MRQRYWMVRAGRGGQIADDFVDQGVVAIGWGDIACGALMFGALFSYVAASQ